MEETANKISKLKEQLFYVKKAMKDRRFEAEDILRKQKIKIDSQVADIDRIKLESGKFETDNAVLKEKIAKYHDMDVKIR